MTRQNIDRATARRGEFRQAHADIGRRIDSHRGEFRNEHRRDYALRAREVRSYYRNDHFRYYYSGWYRHGFYGGFFYPVRPILDIDVYFDYPAVSWLFNPYYDVDYYRAWYPDYDQYPVTPFANVGVFYPTDTIRDVCVEVSSMPTPVQAKFRVGMSNLVQGLSKQLADNLQAPVVLAENDLVVNHYENLNGNAIVMEGFIDRGDLHYAFKALVDLQNPDQTIVFIPTTQSPTDADLAALDAMNQKIVTLGGNPFTADEEPAVAN